MPYLTHTDFERNIKELTDLCDYLVINLCEDNSTSGISQYYKNEKALDKLLKQITLTRNLELGKTAAYQYE